MLWQSEAASSHGTIMQALELLTSESLEHMYTLVTDRFGSHVMRKLICNLTGWEVLPAQAKNGSSKVCTFRGTADSAHVLYCVAMHCT